LIARVQYIVRVWTVMVNLIMDRLNNEMDWFYVTYLSRIWSTYSGST
jgi:hypothetical protein